MGNEILAPTQELDAPVEHSVYDVTHHASQVAAQRAIPASQDIDLRSHFGLQVTELPTVSGQSHEIQMVREALDSVEIWSQANKDQECPLRVVRIVGSSTGQRRFVVANLDVLFSGLTVVDIDRSKAKAKPITIDPTASLLAEDASYLEGFVGEYATKRNALVSSIRRGHLMLPHEATRDPRFVRNTLLREDQLAAAALYARGISDFEIAQALHKSPADVTKLLTGAMERLNVESADHIQDALEQAGYLPRQTETPPPSAPVEYFPA